jgi:Rps23 Pro-64 3,4-dihydroxylase Tpa1-like proline 4-hydroxylase
MKQIELKTISEELSAKIANALELKEYFSEPFKHIIIDDFFPTTLAEKVSIGFDNISLADWEYTNDVGIEIKYRTKWKSEFDIPQTISPAIRILNSAPVLTAMGERLGIPKLMPDPYFTGGGLNMTKTGGILDIHVDGNYHDASGLNRRVNILIYLTKGWEPSWGGEFGIYDKSGDSLVKAVAPLYNRCVIFDTHDRSYHGLPNPIKFPKGRPRKSILLYYYTKAQRPNNQITTEEPHSALWKSKNFNDKRGEKKRNYK